MYKYLLKIKKGKPTPSVKWYKEGNELEPNATEQIEISFEPGVGVATLAIRQVTLKDTGRYTCVARNVIGSCSSSATITIQGSIIIYFYYCVDLDFLNKFLIACCMVF